MSVTSPSTPGGSPPPVPSATRQRSISLCRKCGRPIDPGFAYCPYCGQRQKQGHAWYYEPVWIIFLALFVLGPLALPLVWRSARMDRAAKLALTAGILVYTAVTLYYFFQVVTYEFRVIGELNELL